LKVAGHGGGGVGTGVVHRDLSSASAPAAVVSTFDAPAPVEAPVVIPAVPDADDAAPLSLDRRQVYHAIKVAFEWSLAVLMLASTAPLIALLAALVKLTSNGPAFYLQTRLGRNGKAFRICKLRTMAHNCEAATGPVWASKEDPRVTPIGRLLRDTHLDELPQLWNVVRGDMSLIGPRPERPEIVARIERALPGYRGRLLVRPGVTGLAQMRVPADTGLESVRQKLAHDVYYIQNLGIVLDLRIAVCTFFFFAHLACQAVCSAVVGSYGREVESRLGGSAEVAEA
jgi:lipopolysaccharide/colanic/teichoic acid biosynthesis glycosyltransferase